MSPNITIERLNHAADFVSWIELHRTTLVAFAQQRLKAGQVDSYDRGSTLQFSEQDLAALPLLLIYLIVARKEYAEVYYDCDLLPTGRCGAFGEIQISVRQGSMEPFDIRLTAGDTLTKASNILARPVPREIEGFVNSLPDRFVSTAATRGWFRFNEELTQKLAEAIRLVELGIATTAEEARRYLRSVQLLLQSIAREAESASE
ncbi:hypothetical protein NA78x_000284 [Anatilimnocola sp. NA78]|uniref:hypothetical protein n=1 Tax=Anatilimnocola sp. NA78 TaxID=3415683 RepID=UPI003CE523A2